MLIDGGSGSGKSTLGALLAERWPTPVQVVSVDAFHQGWQGLAAGAAMVADTLLRPDAPGYRSWDWKAGRPGAWVDVDPTVGLIVEGCGALTPANRTLATAGIWVVAGREERKRRALGRGCGVFAAHWDEWAAQERTHWRTHRPRSLADWWWVDGSFRCGLAQ